MHRLFTEEKAMFFCAFPASSPSSSFVCASVLCAPGPVSPFSPSARGRPRSSAVFRPASFHRFHRAPLATFSRSSAVFHFASFLRFHRARSRPSPFLRRFPPCLVSPFSPRPARNLLPFLRRFPPYLVSPFSPPARGRPRSSAVFRLAPFLPFFPPHALEQSAAKGPVPACPSRVFDRLVDGAAGFPATAAPRLRRKPVAFRGRSLQSGDVGSGAWEIPPQTPFVPAVYAAGNDKSAKELSPFALSDRRKPHWGGLEGQSPPNAIRTRRHARRVRKPCAARFPCTFPRPRPQAQGKRVLAEKAGSAGLFRQTESAKGLGPFALSGYFQQSQAPRRAFRRAAAF